MKLTVKTLKGTQFEIRVQPNDTVRNFPPYAHFDFLFPVSCVAFVSGEMESFC